MKTRKRNSAWWLIGLLLCASVRVTALEVTAVVTAYNAVELKGDITYSMDATFDNSNHSKGNITADHEAVLTITNMPTCTVTQIDLRMKSNAKSGAGEVNIVLGNKLIAQIGNSDFCDWPGVEGYSTTVVPVVFEGQWKIEQECDLTVDIKASANTLTLDRVIVTYLTAEPDPFTVTLSWLDKKGSRQSTYIQEKFPGSGVTLPASEVIEVGDGWKFVGWSNEKIADLYTSEPAMLKVGEKCYPKSDMTLYAVYNNIPSPASIPQATEFVSGEYVIATKGISNYYLMTGEVADKKVGASAVTLATDEDGKYYIPSGYASEYCRYQFEFEEDSVTIKYLLTGTFVGHNSTTLTNKKAKWAWREAKNHSLELSFGRQEKESGAQARVLWLDGVDNAYKATILKLGQDYEYILLFEVSNAPTTGVKAKWTCCPFGAEQAIEEVKRTKPETEKILREGQVIIRIDNEEFDILGRKLN